MKYGKDFVFSAWIQDKRFVLGCVIQKVKVDGVCSGGGSVGVGKTFHSGINRISRAFWQIDTLAGTAGQDLSGAEMVCCTAVDTECETVTGPVVVSAFSTVRGDVYGDSDFGNNKIAIKKFHSTHLIFNYKLSAGGSQEVRWQLTTYKFLNKLGVTFSYCKQK